MSVRLENGPLTVEGACTIEEAEVLHAELRGFDGVAIDLTAAGHLHTAIVQILVSLTGPVRGIGDDRCWRLASPAVWLRNRECAVAFAEALDRLSHDKEDTAALYQQCTFHNIRLITLQEGDITPLHVGLKCTMNARYLTDLAFKTRRGQAGRIGKGASAGGLSYGYDAVVSDGVRGQCTINMAEAAIVTRIFEGYAAGQAPRQIAHDLNAERIPGPSGQACTQSTIIGNRQSGTGILNNALYEGRLV